MLLITLITKVESGLRTSEIEIYQTKYCDTTFLALPHIAYIIFNCPIVGKTTLLYQKLQQTHHNYRIAPKIAKTYQNLLYCSFNKVLMRKKLLQDKFDLTIN